MRRVLILGGAGFIGSKTAVELQKLNNSVLIIDNLSTGRKENLDKNIKFIKTDIGNLKRMHEVFKSFKPNIIFNFAFNVLVPKSIENPLLEVKSIKDHIAVLGLCKKYGVRKIVFPSTGFVYGNINRNIPLNENDKISLENPYSIAKYTAEKFTIYYQKKFNLDYTILRYAAVFGPGQVTGAMSDYIRSAKKNITCNFWGYKKTRDYVFIDDAIKANLKCLDNVSSKKIFNIGTGKGTNLYSLYLKICKKLNVKPKPKFYNQIIGEQDNYKLNSFYAKKILDWEPITKLNDGLEMTIDYHLKNNL